MNFETTLETELDSSKRSIQQPGDGIHIAKYST
jgi:hypothetical protein